METSNSQLESNDDVDKETPEIVVASDKENGDLHVDTKEAEKDVEAAVDCQKHRQDNDRVVTLRRQNISLDNISTFTEDEYNFSNFVIDSHSFRSRKKTEIGSEQMISHNVSNYSIKHHYCYYG